MQRCLQLAENGLGEVAPNPLVGAILVYKGKIIGEGWHKKFGTAHAEVNCINSVKSEHKHLISHSTLYVNLEPCNHYGKTPPCSLLILENQIKNVVIGSTDPNPAVSGSGIKRLRDAGVTVAENVLLEECNFLNRRFFTFHSKKRPFVILKIAQSADGFMAPEGQQQLWLTNKLSQRLSHRWRTEEQAILVGKNTALIDNPELSARLWKGNNPLRIVIDKNNAIPNSNKLFNNVAETLIFNALKTDKQPHIEKQQISFTENVPIQILNELYKRNIQSVIIEGGSITANHFLQENLVDEVRLLTAPILLGKGIKRPLFNGKLLHQYNLQNNVVEIFRLTRG